MMVVYPSSELFQHFDTKIKAYQLLQHACLTLYRLKKKTQTLGRQKECVSMINIILIFAKMFSDILFCKIYVVNVY